MTIDERLERLAERHAALTQSAEMHEKRFEEIGEKIRNLAVIAERRRDAGRHDSHDGQHRAPGAHRRQPGAAHRQPGGLTPTSGGSAGRVLEPA
jgi:hypothetical protein